MGCMHRAATGRFDLLGLRFAHRLALYLFPTSPPTAPRLHGAAYEEDGFRLRQGPVATFKEERGIFFVFLKKRA